MGGTEYRRTVRLERQLLNAGMTPETVTQYERLCAQGDASLAARKSMILAQREWLEERIASMEQSLELMDCWIEEMSCRQTQGARTKESV